MCAQAVRAPHHYRQVAQVRREPVADQHERDAVNIPRLESESSALRGAFPLKVRAAGNSCLIATKVTADAGLA